MFGAVLTLLFAPALFGTAGTPWNQDYPCPDLDCSTMTADYWAEGMYSCTVKKGPETGCVTCAIDAATSRAVCVKVPDSKYCRCKTETNSQGIRVCRAQDNCKYSAW